MLQIDTKQILANSLIDLSKRMPIEKIKVTDIVKNCDAGRQTFYNHFQDKYELINWIYITKVDKIIDERRGTEPWGIVLGRTLEYMKEHNKFFGNVICEQGPESFYRYLYKYTQRDYIQYITATHGESVLTEELMFGIRFNSFGAVNMAKEWLENGAIDPPMTLGMRIADSMPPLVRKYFAKVL